MKNELTLNKIMKRDKEIIKQMLPILKKKYQIKSIENDSVFIHLNKKDDIEITVSNDDLFLVSLWSNKQQIKGNQYVKKECLIPYLDELIKLYNMGYYNRSIKEIEKIKAWYK